MVTAKAAWLQPTIHKDTCMSSYIKAFIAVNTVLFTGSRQLVHHWQAVQLASSPAAPGVTISPVFFASELLKVAKLLLT